MKQSNTLVQQNNTLVQQNTEMIEKLKMAEQDNKHTNTGTKHQETLEKVPGEKKIPGSDMEYNITECDKESQISALPKVHRYICIATVSLRRNITHASTLLACLTVTTHMSKSYHMWLNLACLQVK